MDGAVNQTPSPAVDGRLTRLAHGLWPARCLVCGERGAGGRDLCRHCQRALPWNHCACPRCALPLAVPAAACGRCLKRPPPLDAVRAAFVYGTPLDRLLPRLKFHDDLAAGRLLAALMLDDPKRPLAAPWDELRHPVAARASDERWRGLTAPASDDPQRTPMASPPERHRVRGRRHSTPMHHAPPRRPATRALPRPC